MALLWIKIIAFTLFHAFAILHGKLFRLGLATLNEEPLSLGPDLVLVSQSGHHHQVEAEVSAGSEASGAFGCAGPV